MCQLPPRRLCQCGAVGAERYFIAEGHRPVMLLCRQWQLFLSSPGIHTLHSLQCRPISGSSLAALGFTRCIPCSVTVSHVVPSEMLVLAAGELVPAHRNPSSKLRVNSTCGSPSAHTSISPWQRTFSKHKVLLIPTSSLHFCSPNNDRFLPHVRA